MNPSAASLCALALLLAAPAWANPELARSRICLGCHGVAEKKIGPSFKDVAARYANQPGAQARLAEKIVKGGNGAWGAVPMPANPKVTADEAKQLAAWVLTIK